MMLVVIEKKSATFSFPEGVLDLAEEQFARLVHGKSKWAVMSAAVLAFSQLKEDEQLLLVGRVRAAENDDVAMRSLVDEARGAELLAWLDAEMKKRGKAIAARPTTSASTKTPESQRRAAKQFPKGGK